MLNQCQAESFNNTLFYNIWFDLTGNVTQVYRFSSRRSIYSNMDQFIMTTNRINFCVPGFQQIVLIHNYSRSIKLTLNGVVEEHFQHLGSAEANFGAFFFSATMYLHCISFAIHELSSIICSSPTFKV